MTVGDPGIRWAVALQGVGIPPWLRDQSPPMHVIEPVTEVMPQYELPPMPPPGRHRCQGRPRLVARG